MKDWEWRKVILYLVTGLLGTALVLTWEKEHRTVSPSSAINQTNMAPDSAGSQNNTTYTPQSYLPTEQSKSDQNQFSSNALSKQTDQSDQLIHVKTDVLDVSIDPKGGDLVSAKLIKYPVSVDQPNVPVQILSADPQQLYVSQTGIISQSNQPLPVINYHSDQTEYQLPSGEKVLQVKLIGKTPEGIQVEKMFVFTRGLYAVNVNYQLDNQSDKPWSGSFYQQITRGGFIIKTSLHGRSYTGPSISSPKVPYEKISFKKMTKENLDRQIQGGWLAMQQQYFLSSWIPPQNDLNHFYSHVNTSAGNNIESNIYTIGYLSPSFTLDPGKNIAYKSTFYVGPELPSHLRMLALNLDRTIDYGWLWFISKFIFWVMQHIHHVLGNWGWSIVAVTLLVRAALYWFAARSYRSMAKMREVQPRLKALKERLGEDKQALSKATMELYRKEKINPMGGCLPMIVQIPVFFALYYVLIESVELRQAPFILWVRDLSVHDPFYVLPILMGLSMLAQQKLSPPPPDPTQAKMMMLLPVIFTIFFLSFPAGLVLYWLTNNCATVLQQWYVMRSYNPKEEKEKERKKKYKKKVKI